MYCSIGPNTDTAVGLLTLSIHLQIKEPSRMSLETCVKSKSLICSRTSVLEETHFFSVQTEL